jgi:flagella basal body P-ring formation protein FlgA
MMTTAKTRSQSTITTPSIDAADVQRAANEVSAILRKTSPDSVVGAVLQQTLRELKSLKQSAEGTVVGPFRMKAD